MDTGDNPTRPTRHLQDLQCDLHSTKVHSTSLTVSVGPFSFSAWSTADVKQNIQGPSG